MKSLFVILGLLVGGGVLYLLLPNYDSSKREVASSFESIEEEALLELPNEPGFDLEVIEKELEQEEKVLLEPKKLSLKEESPVVAKELFEEVRVEEVAESVPFKRGLTPASALIIKPKTIANIKVGDVVALPFLNDARYEAKITDKIVHKDGSSSVSGDLIDTNDGKHYGVVLTEGKHSAFGSVTTPEGSYEIEVIDGKGYAYLVEDIENQRIDYHKADVLEIKPHP